MASALTRRVRVFAWFSYSHWGMFREPLLTCPELMTCGMYDVDDEDIEEIEAPARAQSEDASRKRGE